MQSGPGSGVARRPANQAAAHPARIQGSKAGHHVCRRSREVWSSHRESKGLGRFCSGRRAHEPGHAGAHTACSMDSCCVARFDSMSAEACLPRCELCAHPCARRPSNWHTRKLPSTALCARDSAIVTTTSGCLQSRPHTCNIELDVKEKKWYSFSASSQVGLDGAVSANLTGRLSNLTGNCEHHSVSIGRSKPTVAFTDDQETDMSYRLRLPRIFGRPWHAQTSLHQLFQNCQADSSYLERMRGLHLDLIRCACAESAHLRLAHPTQRQLYACTSVITGSPGVQMRLLDVCCAISHQSRCCRQRHIRV
jgi:hypothetical protein